MAVLQKKKATLLSIERLQHLNDEIRRESRFLPEVSCTSF